MPTYWLTGIEGNARKVRQPLKGSLLIGRGAYNHVVLKDGRISRQHARIALEDEGCVVYDLGSTNGTFVNGSPVKRQLLHLHDEVSFGSLTFRITAGAPEDRADGGEELETPTLRDLGSLTKMTTSGPASSSTQLPVVDLGQLEDAYDRLGTLYSFMQTISQTIESAELLGLIASKTREIYQASSSVAIYLAVGEAGGAGQRVFRLAHFAGAEPSDPAPAWLPPDVASAVLGSPKGVLTSPAPGRSRGGMSMFAPMIDHGETVGVIHVAAGMHTGGFVPADLDLLTGMAAPASMMWRNAQNRIDSLQRERLSYDLELAAQIQRSFLPREVVSVQGVDLFAEYRAAYSVGGDFYDVFWVAPDRLGVFIGDISGKGVAGALLMARISSEMRVAALAHVEPAAVLTAMNRALLGRNQPELFYTAIYLTLDVKTGEVELANAGHPSPYLARTDGTLLEVTEGAAGPIGIVEDAEFVAARLYLGHGDTLVLYTDGVIEAASATGLLYGTDRLEGVLLQADTRPHNIAERILASVASHLGDVPANDDLTLFICQRNVGRVASMQPRRRSGQLEAVRLPASGKLPKF